LVEIQHLQGTEPEDPNPSAAKAAIDERIVAIFL